MFIDYTGTFNIPLLTQEIIDEFPALDDPQDMLLTFESINGGSAIRITVPDTATPQQLERLTEIVQAHNPASLSRGQQAKQTVVTLAQSAVGVPLAQLTNDQIRALLVCLLHKAGGLDETTVRVKPLNTWL